MDFTGEVLCVKLKEDFYGETFKMLVRSDDGGWKLWATVPSAILGEGLRGKKISMKVTVTPSDRDEYFAFGKRPAKAKVIGE